MLVENDENRKYIDMEKEWELYCAHVVITYIQKISLPR